jgi:hypothetical protein
MHEPDATLLLCGISPCTCDGGVHCNADDAGARQPREICILKLLPHCPGYEVALQSHQMRCHDDLYAVGYCLLVTGDAELEMCW